MYCNDVFVFLFSWFAKFQQFLKSFSDESGCDGKFGYFPSQNRWNVDQVPASFFDPKSTYETKGATRVHIASNGAADGHRLCTLQVLIRNLLDNSLPRRGQPGMTICFPGQGKTKRIQEERKEYHPGMLRLICKLLYHCNLFCSNCSVQ